MLERIFSKLESSRTGRHQTLGAGEGSVELQSTCPYTFGDSITQMDIPQSFTNAILRSQSRNEPLRLSGEDIVVHRTRNTPKCATSVIMDMSGSMRYEGQYINVKKMALALQGLMVGNMDPPVVDRVLENVIGYGSLRGSWTGIQPPRKLHVG